jgi:hypothetical protein
VHVNGGLGAGMRRRSRTRARRSARSPPPPPPPPPPRPLRRIDRRTSGAGAEQQDAPHNCRRVRRYLVRRLHRRLDLAGGEWGPRRAARQRTVARRMLRSPWAPPGADTASRVRVCGPCGQPWVRRRLERGRQYRSSTRRHTSTASRAGVAGTALRIAVAHVLESQVHGLCMS